MTIETAIFVKKSPNRIQRIQRGDGEEMELPEPRELQVVGIVNSDTGDIEFYPPSMFTGTQRSGLLKFPIEAAESLDLSRVNPRKTLEKARKKKCTVNGPKNDSSRGERTLQPGKSFSLGRHPSECGRKPKNWRKRTFPQAA